MAPWCCCPTCTPSRSWRLGRSELLDEIGEEYLFADIDDALALARKHLGLSPEQPSSTPQSSA